MTLKLEKQIFKATRKQGVFGCLEVTIGWWGKERVDYLTYDTKGIWRCYEIKVSKADFHSKAHNTFIGHYNYYVMPIELFKEVESEIPKHIGVYSEHGNCIKNAKRQDLQVDEIILKDSMIRSLSRYFQNQMFSDNKTLIEQKNQIINMVEKERNNYRERYQILLREVQDKFGTRWNKEEVL